jgi:Family of unknown function (DUF6804)
MPNNSAQFSFQMKRIAGLYIAWLVAAGMLVYAVIENHPYSYYTLLGWICCAIFAYSAVSAFEMNRVAWTWIFGVLAGLYNPIFRVHLDRSTWIGVNWFHSRCHRGRCRRFLAEASAQCSLRLEEEWFNRGVRGMTQLIQAVR